MASIILNGENQSFLTSMRYNARMSLPFQHYDEDIFANSIAKRNNITQIEMEHNAVFVHMWHDCLYRNFKKKKLAPELGLINRLIISEGLRVKS